MSFETASNGRRFERFDILDYAMVSSPNHEEAFRSVIVDIGLGGIQLRSKDKLPVGDVCTLQIGQGSKAPVEIKGEVRYSNVTDDTGLYSSGFKFLPTSHEERAAIAEYVHSVFMRQGDTFASAKKANKAS